LYYIVFGSSLDSSSIIPSWNSFFTKEKVVAVSEDVTSKEQIGFSNSVFAIYIFAKQVCNAKTHLLNRTMVCCIQRFSSTVGV
jgi:hypothetical protein